jgi:hypothetical protein
VSTHLQLLIIIIIITVERDAYTSVRVNIKHGNYAPKRKAKHNPTTAAPRETDNGPRSTSLVKSEATNLPYKEAHYCSTTELHIANKFYDLISKAS